MRRIVSAMNRARARVKKQLGELLATDESHAAPAAGSTPEKKPKPKDASGSNAKVELRDTDRLDGRAALVLVDDAELDALIAADLQARGARVLAASEWLDDGSVAPAWEERLLALGPFDVLVVTFAPRSTMRLVERLRQRGALAPGARVVLATKALPSGTAPTNVPVESSDPTTEALLLASWALALDRATDLIAVMVHLGGSASKAASALLYAACSRSLNGKSGLLLRDSLIAKLEQEEIVDTASAELGSLLRRQILDDTSDLGLRSRA